MVSISSGLDLDAARPSSLLGSPERTKSKDIYICHDIITVKASYFDFFGEMLNYVLIHLFKWDKWLMLYGGKDSVEPRTLVVLPWSCKGCA